MPVTTQTWKKKNIESPDEVREFPNDSGSMKVIDLGEETLGYVTFKPGWKWSKDMKPKVGGESCQTLHNMFCISGRMVVKMEDSTEFEVGPGDACFIAPGHDAWIVGDEPFIGLDWTGARTYAK